jgi:hypothetical protein
MIQDRWCCRLGFGEAARSARVRSRRSRERRRGGLRCVTIEIRDEELEAFVRRGLLSDAARCDVEAIKQAVYSYFDATLV